MSLDVITFGCRLNAYESEAAREKAAAAGLSDAIIVNTCAVTAEAVRQAEQAIRRAKRERPGATLIVTGCAAQIEPDRFAAMGEADFVVGNAEKTQPGVFAAIGAGLLPRVSVGDIAAAHQIAPHMMTGFGSRTRAYIEVQNGCDHRCTFCIIPYGRGPSRSLPLDAAVRHVRALADAGIKEVVLTGVDITSYGNGLPDSLTLGGLVRGILRAVPGLPRLRLSSIDTIEADDALIAAFAEEDRLMPHLHLSLQSGDDMILKRMKRRHNRGHAIAFCERLRALRPDIVFGADLIAGFPTEDDAMFENTMRLVSECGLTYLHVFPFSPRPGTPAARMPQVDRAVVKARAARLRAAGRERLDLHLDGQQGAMFAVLFEGKGRGRTPGFTEVEAAADDGLEAGRIYTMRAIGRRQSRLLGETVQ